ncbi:ComEA family DNA-binding protein [Thermogemmata fonticola]|jgi:competence protein ComEA|nr:helix-hairpin-helix domain-containing protein [Thermogemmata fonticola]
MTAARCQGHEELPVRAADEEPPSALGLFLVLGGLAAVLIVETYGPALSRRPVERAALPAQQGQLQRAEWQQVPGMTARKLQEVAQGSHLGNGPMLEATGASASSLEAGGSEAGPAYLPEAPGTSGPPGGARAAPAPTALRAGGVRKIQPGEPPIAINRASNAELQRLPNVGPVLAQRIILARSERPFRSLEDLRRVPGIGPKTLEKLRPFVTFD